jgi:DNA integrity scanning protein DisA with diadenylate cyclase activity
MVVTRKTGLGSFESTGDRLDARISVTLLESIFQKESPLHDGAVIITGTRITAARCVLPVSEQESLPSRMGMRHRAALGLAERTDALIAVVSEQTGEISLAQEGQLSSRLKPKELEEKMRKAYSG